MDFRLAGRHPLLRRELQMARGDRRELVIDARRLCFASPLDLTAAAALAHTYAKASTVVRLLVPECAGVAAYVQRMDLFHQMPDAAQIDGTVPPDVRQDHSTTLLEVTPLSAGTAQSVNERLGRMAEANFGAQAGARIFAGVGELIDNATSHGSSSLGAFVAAQAYSGRTTAVRRLEVAICDTGVGVLSHLRRNPKNAHIANNAEALAKALEPGITGTDEERGNGLPDLLTATARAGTARLVMRSGDGLMRVGRRRDGGSAPVSLNTRSPVAGTWAWVRVSFPP